MRLTGVMFVLLLIPLVLACETPSAAIGRSVEFCADVYSLDSPVSITASNVVINCTGTVLKSWSGGTGFVIKNVENVTVSGCRLVSYDLAFDVENASRVLLEDNHLVRNKVGVRALDVRESATFNHDISLESPFDVIRSANNAFSLTNKYVDGVFCDKNFCNEQRNAIERFMIPATTLPQLKHWLVEHVTGKREEALRDWVFGFLKTD